MLTLPLYVTRDTAKPTLLAIGVMLGLVWLLQSLRFLDLLINKGLELGVFLHLTLLLVPLLLTMIVPLGLFAGVCATLRRWQEDNEITAVLATGRPPTAILKPLLGWAFAAVAFGYALYLVILPDSTAAFKDLQYQIRTQNGQLLLEEGTFNQLGDNLMVYLKKRVTQTTLDQLLVHDTRDPRQPVTWYARSGEVKLGPDGYPQLVLQDGLRQEVGKKQVSMLEFKQYNLDIRQSMGQQILQPRNREQEEYLLPELWDKTRTSPDPKERREMNAELHKRLLWPLTPLPLVLLAAAWLLRPPKRQQSSWRLLVGAAVSGVLYMAALMALFGASKSGAAWALYGQWLLPLAATGLAWLVARRGMAHA
jgi:lipopolysaccharide export system permease protein